MKTAALLALAALAAAGRTHAETGFRFAVVDTHQSSCYSASAAIACPAAGTPFYGQDAQHIGNGPAYRDNADGTVSDLTTGLMWVKDPGAKVSFATAVAGAAASRVGGYSDWRLPTLKELYSLIEFSGLDASSCMSGGSCGAVPFLDTAYFDFQYGNTSAGERIIDAQYWSATPYVSTTMNGNATEFGVNFADGRIKGYPRDGVNGGTTTQFVRYVRGGSGYGSNHFADNGDGTVTDRAANLMWSRADSGSGMDWQAALAWVARKNAENYLGHSDWRLPNAKELQSIVDYGRSPDTTGSAAIDPLFQATAITNEGGARDWPYYWSSTTHAAANGSADFAVYVAFGRALGYMQGTNGSGYTLMDVHGAGAQRSDPKSGSAASYPHGHGPQGDVVRIANFVRLVRDAGLLDACAAALSDDMSRATLPIVSYQGQSWQATLGVDPAAGRVSVAGYAPLGETAEFQDCTPATGSADLRLHIPVLMHGGRSYQVELTGVGGLTFAVTEVAAN